MKEKRSLDLIADFVDGYASGWHFAVGECFKDELDIKFTDRVEDGKEVRRWTQGKLYCFAEGHRIYNTPNGYLQWSEALKHLKLICEVVRAIPNKTGPRGRILPGQVTFKLSKPNATQTNVETVGQHHLSQDGFVEFLKTGILKEDLPPDH